MINTLLTFGAKSVNPKILEKTLTVRKKTVDEIERNCVAKILKKSTYQSLIIATRGSGKTHIIKVLYHRFMNNKKIAEKKIIAYMSEDEVGIASFTDLLVSILRSFMRYKVDGSEKLQSKIEEASEITDTHDQVYFLKKTLNDFAGKRIIIMLIENLDKILKALKKEGQAQLRDFMHEYNNLSIIASSQNLISSIQDSEYPFYNFFNIFHLKKLSYHEAVEFIKAIAEVEKNKSLLNEMNTTEFQGKIRAIYELTEGNHRLLVTFYSFLKAEYKSELSDIFIKVMNNLKPYYEQFVNALSPQKQKIVKYLSLNRRAVKGKEIAKACFLEQRTNSKILALLVKEGMIDKNKSGNNVFYELKEPLMRISFEIGENPTGISKLFIDFLSAFYSIKEISEKYLKFSYGAKFQSDDKRPRYRKEALMYEMALKPEIREQISNLDNDLSCVNDNKELYNKIDEVVNNLDKKEQPNIYLSESLKTFNNGIKFFELKEYKKAIENFKKTIEINPNDSVTFYNIGVAYDKLKEYKKAVNNYKKAIEINPNDDNIFYNIGGVYDELKEYKKAIECYKNAIKINPKHNLAYNNIGSIYGELKEYKKAIENFKKAIEINPNDENAFYNIGVVYDELKEYKKAIESYKKAIEINPKHLFVYNNMGIIYTNLTEFHKAIESFKKAIEINQKNDLAYNNMGIIYNKLKEYKKAINCYKKAIKINPKFYLAFYNKGVTNSELKEYDNAIENYKIAIKINPNNHYAHNGIGLIYLIINEIENAVKSFKKGLEIKPDCPYTNFSLLGAYIRANDIKNSKEQFKKVVNIDEDIFIPSFSEDVFYNFFKFGSDFFIKTYSVFLIKTLYEAKKIKSLSKALPKALFEILININDYSPERLNYINEILTKQLSEYPENIIILKMFAVGIEYLKNNEKDAIYNLSKEERKVFTENVLEIRKNKK
ncbi:MAG: tetratricopeptide repeat protein [Bacteroidales bacterium]|nr:tetratricopeptide repeat protein [Bacteroidales bacterium]